MKRFPYGIAVIGTSICRNIDCLARVLENRHNDRGRSRSCQARPLGLRRDHETGNFDLNKTYTNEFLAEREVEWTNANLIQVGSEVNNLLGWTEALASDVAFHSDR